MKISVVMAVFNGEDYLEDTVKSILEQSYRDFEFIIVNDGSTDSTGKILEQFKDRRIRLIQLDHNSGPAAALNLAVQNARGSWIAVQDTGDMSYRKGWKAGRYLRIYSHIAALFFPIECLPGKKSF